MRFLAGIVVGALGVLAYQRKDELKENAVKLKETALQSAKNLKESVCTEAKNINKKAKHKA